MSKQLNELIKCYEDKGQLCLSLSANDNQSKFNLNNFEEIKVNTYLSESNVSQLEFDKKVFANLDTKNRQTRGKEYPLFINKKGNERFINLELKSITDELCSLVLFCQSAENDSLFVNVKVAENSKWRLVFISSAEAVSATYFNHNIKDDSRLEFITISLSEDLLSRSFMSKEGPDPSGYHIYSIAQVGKDAYYHLQQVSLGGVCGGKSVAELCQEGAEAYLDTACFVEENCVQSYELETVHHAPHTTSDINSYGVVAENARGELIGRGDIDKGSFASSCQQDSRLLALDSTSEALCYPLLLINEYDVIAGHSSGVGQVDEDAVFYLRSRGLNEKDSKRLMIAAFLKPNIEKIMDDTAREYLVDRLDAKVVNR